MEAAAIFVIAALLLGKWLLVVATSGFLLVLLYFTLWRGIFPQPQDPVVPRWVRIGMCIITIGLLLRGVGLAYDLALQTRDLIESVF
jgi:hypothetical protein